MPPSQPTDTKHLDGHELPPPLPGWDPDHARRDANDAAMRPASSSAANVLRTNTDVKIRRLLGWCGAARTPALIATTSPARILTARFQDVRGEQVSLLLDTTMENARAVLIGDEEPVVMFTLDRRSTAFHSPVHQISTEDNGVVAVFGLPVEVTHSDSRASSRVKVATSCGLTMTLAFDGQATEIMARDLSIAGARASLLVDNPSVHAGQTVDATFTIGSLQVTLSAQIRRRQGLDLGLLFPDCAGGRNTPEVFREILQEIEARRPQVLARSP